MTMKSRMIIVVDYETETFRTAVNEQTRLEETIKEILKTPAEGNSVVWTGSLMRERRGDSLPRLADAKFYAEKQGVKPKKDKD